MPYPSVAWKRPAPSLDAFAIAGLARTSRLPVVQTTCALQACTRQQSQSQQ